MHFVPSRPSKMQSNGCRSISPWTRSSQAMPSINRVHLVYVLVSVSSRRRRHRRSTPVQKKKRKFRETNHSSSLHFHFHPLQPSGAPPRPRPRRIPSREGRSPSAGGRRGRRHDRVRACVCLLPTP